MPGIPPWKAWHGIMDGVTVNTLLQADWPGVRSIYRQGITTGNATFEVVVPSWSRWDAAHLPCCRYVARLAGCSVAGWAALSPVSTRPAYSGVAEVSVYVRERQRERGIGRLLLDRLIRCSTRQGLWTLQGAVFPENEASLRLLAGAGFRVVGVREKIGRLHGVWRDVVLLERRDL